MEMKTFCCFFTLLLLALLVNGNPVAEEQGGKHVLCDFEPAKKSHQDTRFVPEDLDLSICTHLVFNRAYVGEDLHVETGEEGLDLHEVGRLGLINRTIALKERKPGLKVLLFLFDYNGVLRKQAAANNSVALATFAKNAADFLLTRGFDGINLRVRNHEGFLEIAQFLHEEFSRRGFILAMLYLQLNLEGKRDLEMTVDLSRNFDLILVGSHWRFPITGTTIFSSNKELERELNDYAASGIPSEKLVVAIPAFGVSLKLCDREENGVNSSMCGAGGEGTYEPPQMVLHSQVLRKIANMTEKWVVARDEESGCLYGHSKNLQWMSFEDPVSVRAKAAIVLERNLAGISIMNNDMEDFKGAYTENGETFPLTRAAYKALYGKE